MAIIEMKISVSMEETFDDFLLKKKSMGLSDKTLITYKQHLCVMNFSMTNTLLNNIRKYGYRKQKPSLH